LDECWGIIYQTKALEEGVCNTFVWRFAGLGYGAYWHELGLDNPTKFKDPSEYGNCTITVWSGKDCKGEEMGNTGKVRALHRLCCY
jgi:hypothetical protein